jgi:hypothetical protein
MADLTAATMVLQTVAQKAGLKAAQTAASKDQTMVAWKVAMTAV